jgi:glycosyltransferase involved in cell wall biosynthesis
MAKKIIYCYPDISTFIKKDLDLIKKSFPIADYSFNPSKKIFVPFRFLHQLFFLLKNIFTAHLIICRFVGYHSFLPALIGKLTGIPVLLILGGTECHYFPKYNYGGFTNKIYAIFIRLSYKFCSHISPVHESLVISDYDYDESGSPKQGYLYFCPGVTSPVTPIYNGYDSSKFYPKEVAREKNSFLTVAINFDGREYYRKGIDLIFLAAPHLPDATFTIIGDSKEWSSEIPNNVKIIPYIPNDKLPEFYSQNEFYLQLSLAEGFPNALCEAMLCGCIPVGSNVFGIPFIINDTGFILPKRDDQMLVELLKKGMNSDKEQLSLAARKRIMDNFPIARREKELITLVSKLTGK